MSVRRSPREIPKDIRSSNHAVCQSHLVSLILEITSVVDGPEVSSVTPSRSAVDPTCPMRHRGTGALCCNIIRTESRVDPTSPTSWHQPGLSHSHGVTCTMVPLFVVVESNRWLRRVVPDASSSPPNRPSFPRNLSAPRRFSASLGSRDRTHRVTRRPAHHHKSLLPELDGYICRSASLPDPISSARQH